MGLAADIDIAGRLMRHSDKTYQCFEENGFRFGFILSYPPGNNYLPSKDTYEPWHWRYVGIRTAQIYREAGPINHPQEFLAALPCYEERAVASTAGEDVCLDEAKIVAASAMKLSGGDVSSRESAAARKLNNYGQSGHR